MNDLAILIARLGWPVASARWWAMQEIALRLADPAAKTETEVALLQLLRSRKLESEAVEVLFIFWMAADSFDYSPPTELAENIFKPSPLSDLLVTSFGLPLQTHNMSFKEVVDDFEIPEDFLHAQGVDVARIFLTSAGQLEQYSKRPFAQQMAFEWAQNQTAYSDAPYQGGLGYFIRPQSKGFSGSFCGRPALRAISAYLRTLAVAKKFWNMPPTLVEHWALLALPIHLTLAFLKPCRPNWFPAATAFDGDTDVIKNSFRSLLSRIKADRPCDELIAFSSPVVMSNERCVEVSLVRWAKASSSTIDDANLADHLASYWTHKPILLTNVPAPLSTTTTVTPWTLDKLARYASKAWPLAGTLAFERIGYLQRDLYPSRIFLPTIPCKNMFEIIPHKCKLHVKINDKIIADLCYWNVGWGLAWPMQLGGNCGTALISHGTTYREHIGSELGPLQEFYLWQVRTLQRNSQFDEFVETSATGILFD